MRILVVEDEPGIADFLERGLQAEGYSVTSVADGERGEAIALGEDVALVVLDVMLPGKDGFEVLDAIRREKAGLPVILLTARDQVRDKVEGLDKGATDYVTKPFSFDELVARVRALGRRSNRPLPPVLRGGGITLDVAHHRAARDGRPLRLSLKEFAVLEVLLRGQGAVISTEELLERAWDERADPFTNTVRVTVSNLRRKLAGAGSGQPIETVVGVGYRLAEVAE